MKKIVLIACCKSKGPTIARARDLYIGSLFKYSLQYAETLRQDKIFILSAKYYLLDLERMIEPYEMTLNAFSVEERKEWGMRVIEQLSEITSLTQDKFTILAGQKYINPLREFMTYIDEPLMSLRYGERLKFLKSKLGFN